MENFSRQLQCHAHFIILLLLIVHLLLIVYPLTKAGIPISWDASTHFARLFFVHEYLIPSLSTDGWDWFGFNGYRVFQFYSPLFYYVTSLLAYLSFGLLTLEEAFKLVIGFFFVLLPLSMYYFLRSLELDKLPSAVGAVFAAAVSVPYGSGILGVFLVGLIPQAVALPLIFFTLSVMTRGIIKENFILLLFSSMLAFLLFKTHFISAYYLLIATGCLCVSLIGKSLHKLRVFWYLFACGLIFFALVAPDLYLIIFFKEEMGYATGFGPPEAFRTFAEDPAKTTVLLIIIAAMIISTGYRHTKVFPIILMIFMFFITGIGVPDFGFEKLSYPLFVLKNRSYSMFFIFGATFLGVLIGLSADYLLINTAKYSGRFKHFFVIIFTITLIIYPNYVIWNLLREQKQFVKTEYHVKESEFKQNFDQILQWIIENTPKLSGFVIEDLHGPIESKAYGNLHAALAYKTQRRALLDGFVEATRSSHNIDLSIGIKEWSTTRILDTMRMLNMTHVIAYSSEANKKLAEDKNFNKVTSAGKFFVWEATGIRPTLVGSATGYDFTMDEISVNSVSWIVQRQDGLIKTTNARLAISFSPDWKVYVDGKLVDNPERTERNLMSIKIPDRDSFKVELRLERSRAEKTLRFLSLGTILVVIGILVKDRRKIASLIYANFLGMQR